MYIEYIAPGIHYKYLIEGNKVREGYVGEEGINMWRAFGPMVKIRSQVEGEVIFKQW